MSQFPPFPAYVYHAHKPAKVVQTEDEYLALGDEWSLRPVTADPAASSASDTTMRNNLEAAQTELAQSKAAFAEHVKAETDRLAEAQVVLAADRERLTQERATFEAEKRQYEDQKGRETAEIGSIASDLANNTELADLTARARSAGVTVDRRWGIDRLRAAVVSAEANGNG